MADKFAWLEERGDRGELEVFLVPGRRGEGQDVVLRIDGGYGDPADAKEMADWWCRTLNEDDGLRVSRGSSRDARYPGLSPSLRPSTNFAGSISP